MFNKYTKWFALLVFSFFLTSCSWFSNQETDTSNTETPTEQPSDTPDEGDGAKEPNTNGQEAEKINQEVAAWIPRLDNVVYSYEGSGNEFATFKWNPQFNRDNYYQTATNNGGTVQVEIFEYTEEEIIQTFERPETYFRDNFTEIGSFSENRFEEVILKTPLEKGNSWESNGNQYEITATDHQMEVPAGTYPTIEVTVRMDGTEVKRYYAEDIGLVAQINEIEGGAVESKLARIETDAPEVLPFTVYTPDNQALGMDPVKTKLTLKTNDPARLAIQELLSGQNEQYPEVNILPEGTEINYLFLDNDNIVEVDVSAAFETNMNAGSTGELFAIYTFVNTLCQYYGAQEVLLTVEYKPYSGAHMALKEGETLQFNEEMINQ